MIIICPSCEKKFEIDSNLISEKGRLLKCGSCHHTWFFNKNDQINNYEKITTKPLEDKKTTPKATEKINQNIYNDVSKLPNNKGSELIHYQPKFNFSFSKILNYLIVSIISFIAIIIILDTFKTPLSIYFPNIELILYNLFETLKDLILFIKDLN